MMRTSASHPLQIADVEAPTAGVIGITFCPGKYQSAAATGSWARNLEVDLDVVKAWGAQAVVTLVTTEELTSLKVNELGSGVISRGMRWVHLPIEDFSIPTLDWESEWKSVGPELHRILDSDGRLLVHCKGGLGRAGLVAARLLYERGVSANEAIRRVRRHRPGAVETREQEMYLLALK